MPYRHPSVLANIAATVDIISDGRLIVGLGAGWNQEESDALGIRLPPLKERFDQFEEGVQVIIGAARRGDRATFDGAHFTLTDAWCEPKPVQRPHPPIAIGGNGEKRTLRIVAEYAQHWNSTLGDVGAWQRKGAVLEQHCADVGSRPGGDRASVNVRLAGRRRPADAAGRRSRPGPRRRRRHLHHRPRRTALAGRAGPAGRGARAARLIDPRPQRTVTSTSSRSPVDPMSDDVHAGRQRHGVVATDLDVGPAVDAQRHRPGDDEPQQQLVVVA